MCRDIIFDFLAQNRIRMKSMFSNDIGYCISLHLMVTRNALRHCSHITSEVKLFDDKRRPRARDWKISEPGPGGG